RTSAALCTAPLPSFALTTDESSARPPLMAAVTDATPRELVLYDLANGAIRWRKPIEAETRPVILHDVVITSVGGVVLGLDLRDGRERLRVKLSRPSLFGAAQAGQRVFLTMATPASHEAAAATTLAAFDLERGALAWTRDFDDGVGAPQLAGGHVLALLAHRDLLVLDANDGRTTSCSRLPASADWLRVNASGAFVGGSSVRSAASTANDATTTKPPASLPGPPLAFEPDDVSVPGARSAHGRVAWLVQPGSAESGSYFAFYRALFAFDAAGALRWARLLPSDVVRALPNPAGLALVLDDGAMLQLDAASGAGSEVGTLGLRVASAELSGAPPAARTTTLPAVTLDLALTQLASDPDTRLLPARLLAVDALAAQPEAHATCELLQVYQARGAPEELRKRVAERLRARSSGAQCLLDALHTHADYLAETRAPALEAIVPALVAQHEAHALPLLVDHLFDPQTPSPQLTPIVDAIAALGGNDAHEPLARFVALYHADSALGETSEPVQHARRALEPHTRREMPTPKVEPSATAPAAIAPEDGRATTSTTALPTATTKPIAKAEEAQRPRRVAQVAPPEPFWALSKSLAKSWLVPPGVAPWWQDENPLYLSVEPAPAATNEPPAMPTSAKPASTPEPAPATDAGTNDWWVPATQP
ncbi:MAG TPA: PQQ-binding-like beta-propeller repeat protein, partial [Polyangiales bacterium]|nr:PQQ-binding-like beta-propeller repeat protein [Polyangiales bacterium]